METFFYQATIYLSAAVIAVPIAARLGLGSVLGYLLAGVVIGPILGLVGDTENLQHFAEFGVVMMLFLIGLELEPRHLWDMRADLLGLGGLQIGLTTLAFTTIAMAFALPWQIALATGLILALSSTAIVLQTLSEKGLMRTRGGRSTFSVLLTQDIAVIPMLAALPLLAQVFDPQLMPDGSITRAGDHAEQAHGSMSLVEGLPGWGVTLVTLGAVAAVVLTGMFLTRPLFRFIHMAKLRELYTATALLIVISIAFLMTLVGISPALGAFLAGMLLASSEFRHELEADIEPFKGLLLGLFFITVGAGINFSYVGEKVGLLIALTLGLMATKGVILFGLAIAFGLRGRDRMLFALALAQAGEFGFVLISFSLQNSVLPDAYAQTLLTVIALSMLLTPLAFIIYERISRRMGEEATTQVSDKIDEQGTVIVAGIGRFGQVVNRLVQIAGIKTVVLDHDLETIELMRAFGFKGFLGDPTRPELLHAAGLQTARVLVVALDDRDACLKLIRHARQVRPDIHIVGRARDRTHVYQMYRAGANDIVREMFDSSLRAGRYVLENMDFSDFEASEIERTFYRHDRMAIRELAALWDPNIPTKENAAYLARARELNADLEAALLSRLDETPEPRTGTDG